MTCRKVSAVKICLNNIIELKTSFIGLCMGIHWSSAQHTAYFLCNITHILYRIKIHVKCQILLGSIQEMILDCLFNKLINKCGSSDDYKYQIVSTMYSLNWLHDWQHIVDGSWKLFGKKLYVKSFQKCSKFQDSELFIHLIDNTFNKILKGLDQEKMDDVVEMLQFYTGNSSTSSRRYVEEGCQYYC